MAIIAAFKSGETRVYTKSAHQFDRGQSLIITGIELPETFEVHFSNDRDRGISTAHKGSAEGTYIPDVYFFSGDYIYAWIYFVNPVDEQYEKFEGKTEYEVVIPIIPKPVHTSVMQGSGGGIGFIMGDDETLIPVR